MCFRISHPLALPLPEFRASYCRGLSRDLLNSLREAEAEADCAFRQDNSNHCGLESSHNLQIVLLQGGCVTGLRLDLRIYREVW